MKINILKTIFTFFVFTILSSNAHATDSICNICVGSCSTVFHRVFISASENSNGDYLGVFGDMYHEYGSGSQYAWGVSNKEYPGATHLFTAGAVLSSITWGESAMVTHWIGGYHGAYIRDVSTTDTCMGGYAV